MYRWADAKREKDIINLLVKIHSIYHKHNDTQIRGNVDTGDINFQAVGDSDRVGSVEADT